MNEYVYFHKLVQYHTVLHVPVVPPTHKENSGNEQHKEGWGLNLINSPEEHNRDFLEQNSINLVWKKQVYKLTCILEDVENNVCTVWAHFLIHLFLSHNLSSKLIIDN